MNSSEQLPLFVKFPTLKELPHLPLILSPTPIELMANLSQKLAPFSIYVKHDDVSHKLYGGNKPRKFEFIFPHLLQHHKRRILTVGGLGTNQGLAMALHARPYGFQVHLYLVHQPLLPEVRENLLCDYALGAHLHYTKTKFKTVLYILGHLIRDPHAVYIPAGASTPAGTIGFVNAMCELNLQIQSGELPVPDIIFVAAGSSGTAAGLLLGCALLGLPTKIYAVGVTDLSMSSKKKVLKLARKTWKFLHQYDQTLPDVRSQFVHRLIVDHSLFGGLYGQKTVEGEYALMIAAQDAVELDSVYTAKAFSGLLRYCQTHPNGEMKSILYWHTKNSREITSLSQSVSYQQLPDQFHPFFDGSIPFDNSVVACFPESPRPF